MRQITKVAITTISAALALTLTSCSGAGPNAATRMINRVTDGAEAQVTDNGYDIRISNLLLVKTGDSATVLVGNIVNRADESDILTSIVTSKTVANLTGEINLLANKPIFFEGDSANAKAIFAGEEFTPGTTMAIGLNFAKAGRVIVRVIIREASDVYAGITAEPLTAPATAK